MRIAVVGTSGSGKSTLSRRLSGALDLAWIELDAINWQPGWRDLNTDDPAAFQARVIDATAKARWVCDGNYSKVREVVWARATHIVWLDYSRALTVWRVFRRSLARALLRTELWPGTGNREDFGRWLSRDHPIRWAWDTHAKRRLRFEALLAEIAPDGPLVYRVRSNADLRGVENALLAGT